MPKNEDVPPFPPNTPKAVREYLSHKQAHTGLFEKVKAEFNGLLKQISESFHQLEKHEVHAIVTAEHNEPYYAVLGLNHAEFGRIVTVKNKSVKKGRTAPTATKKTIVAGKAKSKAAARKNTSKVTDDDFIKFVGKGEKNTGEFVAEFGQLIVPKLKKSKVLMSRKDGRKVIWKAKP